MEHVSKMGPKGEAATLKGTGFIGAYGQKRDGMFWSSTRLVKRDAVPDVPEKRLAGALTERKRTVGRKKGF